MKTQYRLGLLVAGVVVLMPAPSLASGCSYYGNGESTLSSADVGNGLSSVGEGGGGKGAQVQSRLGASGISFSLTAAPDATPEGRAMIGSVPAALGKQPFNQRLANGNVTAAKAVGGAKLKSGIVAQIYTQSR